jgi:Semialdehyde dehydrogenase, NAD binding domain
VNSHSSENGDKTDMAQQDAQQSKSPLPGGAAKKWRAGVLGATGLVGQRLVKLLAHHPWFELTEVSTPASIATSFFPRSIRA